MEIGIDRAMFDCRACRKFPEIIVVSPIARGPYRVRHKSTAAIRANISDNIFDAIGAEGALETANAGICRIGRQKFIAILAGRSEFEHNRPFLSLHPPLYGVPNQCRAIGAAETL